MRRPGGHDLIVLVFTAILLWHAGRTAFPDEGKPPAFVVEDPPGVAVWLGERFGIAGVRQLDDESTVEGVIQLTGVAPGIFRRSGLSLQEPVFSGQCFLIVDNAEGVPVVRSGTLSAARRLALGIRLHPDRMSREDWLELKGIGPVLANRIETWRQKNGDFGCFERLVKVKGIGPKRIEAWKRFF